MAKIRAYKLAEELGIDRSEIVEKAASVGVEVRSPMVSLEEEEASRLRQKLGSAAVRRELVTEERVERGPGTPVIRRRKKVAPEPVVEPAPEPVEPALQPPVSITAEPAPEPEPVPEVEPVPEPIVEPAPAIAAVAPSAPPAAEREGPAAQEGPQPPDKTAKQRKRVREVVNLREQDRLARQATGRTLMRRQFTLEPRSAVSPRRRRRDAPSTVRPAAAAAPKETKRVIRVEGSVSVGELARMLGEKAPVVQKQLMSLGMMISINQAVDVETARQVASEFDCEVQDVGFREEQYIEAPKQAADGASLVTRPPIITVMGHVDHGKTSLLDAIRHTDVVSGEAGGITQHIGAYQVRVGDKPLTFIDTPGHAAFTSMRARGAQATDIVILVVAANEGIMPQTIEAIDHARAAGVPILVAVNKCDLPGADPQQTRQRLLGQELVPEEFGGETICVDVSATQRTGLEKLLEMVSLQAELLELKAAPTLRAAGVVLEARLDKGRGPVATILIQEGTLKRGEIVVVGTVWGRVRVMEDDNGKRVAEAGPSAPVQVIGLSGVPEAGQLLHAVESERVAKGIVEHRLGERRAQPVEEPPKVSLEDFFAQVDGGGVKELRLVVKADVHGSLEALREGLLKLSTDAVKVDVIHTGVGAITETDVMLAKASSAIIIGFHVRPDPTGRQAAEGEGVDVRSYRVIYEVTDDVRQAMAGLLPPTVSESFLGRAEVRRTFSVPRVGTIAGCYVSEGLIRRGGQCRLLRDGVQVHEGKVGSLKRFKDDAREVATGFECGIGIESYNDVKVGDVIETYVLEEQVATLE
jgi:translation initiation factor IF-2